MKPYSIYILLLFSFACHSLPKNQCECFEEAYRISDHYQSLPTEAEKKSYLQSQRPLVNHCHRISMKSTCTGDELFAIVAKRPSSFLWGLGEIVSYVVVRPMAASASPKIDFMVNIKHYRLNPIDSSYTYPLPDKQ